MNKNRKKKIKDDPTEQKSSTGSYGLTILDEANLWCLLSEASSANHQIIFSNQSLLSIANSAVTGSLSELLWV